jgi:hypothetical protein
MSPLPLPPHDQNLAAPMRSPSTEVNAMHPYVSGLLPRSRAQKLEQAAAAWRAAHPGGSTRPNRSRRHLGTAALRSARGANLRLPSGLGGKTAELEADVPDGQQIERSSARPAQLVKRVNPVKASYIK